MSLAASRLRGSKSYNSPESLHVSVLDSSLRCYLRRGHAIPQTVGKGECIIMGYFNHGHIQWKSLESTRGKDQQF